MMDIPVDYQNPGKNKQKNTLNCFKRVCFKKKSAFQIVTRKDSKLKKPFDSIFLLCILSCYGHVVEHTETVGCTAHAVVTRRSGEKKKYMKYSALWQCCTKDPLQQAAIKNQNKFCNRWIPSPDQSHAVFHLSHQNAVHQLQCRPYSQLGTVIDVLGQQVAREF